MIAVIDYGVGNLFSLVSSLKYIGQQAIVTSDADKVYQADRIILPGVGAYGNAITKLKQTGLVPVIKEYTEKGNPLLGICLGMQMLFEKSYEYGEHNGLGFIKGKVVKLNLPENYKIPHMGWNSLKIKKENPILKYISEGDYVYYVHSYYAADCEKNTLATSYYGIEVTGAVASGNIYGTQFHPEKSGETGLKILKAFTEL